MICSKCTSGYKINARKDVVGLLVQYGTSVMVRKRNCCKLSLRWETVGHNKGTVVIV